MRASTGIAALLSSARLHHLEAARPRRDRCGGQRGLQQRTLRLPRYKALERRCRRETEQQKEAARA